VIFKSIFFSLPFFLAEIPLLDEFEEYEEQFVDLFSDELIAHQENRKDLMNYIHQFSEDECHIVETMDAWFYSQEDDFLEDDPKINALLKRYVKEGSIAIDYGADIGMRSVCLSRLVGCKGSVFAFEPNPERFRKLFWNLKLNHVQNAQLFCKVLGEKEKALDSLNLENVSFIRINAKGREDVFLKGAGRTIQKNKPILIINVIGGIPVDRTDKFLRKELQERLEKIHKMGYTTQRINEREYLALPIKKLHR